MTRLTTRELVIYLMELTFVGQDQPELAAEVADASGQLRRELRRREWLVAAEP